MVGRSRFIITVRARHALVTVAARNAWIGPYPLELYQVKVETLAPWGGESDAQVEVQ
jgi:hypothetical protein